MELTDREKRAARLLLEGKTSREIAAEMGVSKRTVEKYLTELREKTGFPRTSLQAATIAKEQGML